MSKLDWNISILNVRTADKEMLCMDCLETILPGMKYEEWDMGNFVHICHICCALYSINEESCCE